MLRMFFKRTAVDGVLNDFGVYATYSRSLVKFAGYP